MITPTADLEPLPAGFGARWVGTMLTTFRAGRTDALGDLDRQAGDGDFGTNLASALRRAERTVETSEPGDYAGWVTAVSRGFLGTGGTSGPLLGMFFRDLAQCAAGPEPTAAEFAAGLSRGVATVQRYGKAEVGHKTMVDALAPAAAAMTAAVETGGTPDTAFRAAADAGVAGARSTADIVARRGRASYVGEVSRGVLDPGAAAAAIVLQCAAAAVTDAGGVVDTSWVDA